MALALSSEAAHAYPVRARLTYGTAGFRAKAELLDGAMYRIGMLAALRSMKLGGNTVGIMVTASHNPHADNGVKLVDPDGGMLSQAWEQHATAVANAPEATLSATLLSVSSSEGLGDTSGGRVLIGRDTRAHSAGLAAIAAQGARAIGGVAEDAGLLTTPQLHHLVRMGNGEKGAGPLYGKEAWASEGGYYAMLSEAFVALLNTAPEPERRPSVWVDAAHGVGAPKLAALCTSLAESTSPSVVPAIVVANGVDEGELNCGCGAEHVQKARLPPKHFETPLAGFDRAASLDGDADRIVFHYWNKDAEWRLLDGDKISALIVSFVHDQLAQLALDPPLSFAAVQTAYANGAAATFVRGLGVPVAIAKTGVKFLHHVALDYDIAAYFEANGHGTLLFSDVATNALLAAKASAQAENNAAAALAASRLLWARQLVNQAVGDALSDLLLVEAILAMKQWSAADWDAMYSDLPSRQSKLPVADRTAITTTDTEERVLSPSSLQPALDELMGRFGGGRCFVRPSGTEDVVRVYAEAETQEAADELALLSAQATWKLAGGVGSMPLATTA